MAAAAEEKVDEWELLPPNTSFLDFGLEDIKDLFSREIDYMDYFIEQTPREFQPIQLRDEKPLRQATENKSQVYGEKLAEEIQVEDHKQIELKDKSRIEEEEEEDLADKPRSERWRPLVAGLGEVLSIGAAVAAAMVCGFLLGSGRRQEQLRRAESMRFRVYKDDEAMKQMVRQANRINQVLVATAGGMPPPVMQPATISFGGCFNDMLWIQIEIITS